MNRITSILFSPLILCLLLFSAPLYAIPTIQWNPGKLSIEKYWQNLTTAVAS